MATGRKGGRGTRFQLQLHFLAVTLLVAGRLPHAAEAKSKRIADPDIPQTSFSCEGRHNGYYADVETDCRVYHMCLGHEQFSYLCPNTTRFQQRMMVCDHWYQVDCPSAPLSYSANLLIGQRDQPFVPDHEHPALHLHAKSAPRVNTDQDNLALQKPVVSQTARHDLQPELSQSRPTPSLQRTQSQITLPSQPTPTPFSQRATQPTTLQQFQPQPTSSSKLRPQIQFISSTTPNVQFQQQHTQQTTPKSPQQQRSQLQFIDSLQTKQEGEVIQEKQRIQIQPQSQHQHQHQPQPQIHAQFVPLFVQSPSPSDRQSKSLQQTFQPTLASPSKDLEPPIDNEESSQSFFQRSPTSSFAQPFNAIITTQPPSPSVAPITFTGSPSAPSSTQGFTYKFSPSSASSFQPVFQSTTQATTPVTAVPASSSSLSTPTLPPPSRELLPPFFDDSFRSSLRRDDITLSTVEPETAQSESDPMRSTPIPRRTVGTPSTLPPPRRTAGTPSTPPPPSQELLPPLFSDGHPRPFSTLNDTLLRPEKLSLFASTTGNLGMVSSTPQPQIRSTPQPMKQSPLPSASPKIDEPAGDLLAPEESEENFNTVEVKYQDPRRLFFIPGSPSHLPTEEQNQYTVVIKYPTVGSISNRSTMRFKTYSQNVKDRLNPLCPRCHPDFVVPGTCNPCVLLR